MQCAKVMYGWYVIIVYPLTCDITKPIKLTGLRFRVFDDDDGGWHTEENPGNAAGWRKRKERQIERCDGLNMWAITLWTGDLEGGRVTTGLLERGQESCSTRNDDDDYDFYNINKLIETENPKQNVIIHNFYVNTDNFRNKIIINVSNKIKKIAKFKWL